jgi:hypothetical protein
MLNRMYLALFLSLALSLAGCPAKNKEQAPSPGSTGSVLVKMECPGEFGTSIYAISFTGPESSRTPYPGRCLNITADCNDSHGHPCGYDYLIENLPAGMYQFSMSHSELYFEFGTMDPRAVPLWNSNAAVTVVAGKTRDIYPLYTGGLAYGVFSWTVGGEPTDTACPADFLVTIVSTSTPSGTPPISSQPVSCASGSVWLSLDPGQYMFNMTLSGGTLTPPIVIKDIPITIDSQWEHGTSGAAAYIDFPAVGTLSLAWTLGGEVPATACPADGFVEVNTVPRGLIPISATTCTGSPLQIPLLSAGTHTFALSLTSSTLKSVVGFATSITPFTVTTATVDFPESGSMQLAWTINSAPSATTCPAGAVVSVVSISQPGATVAAGPVPCADSLLTVALPDLGGYLFTLTLTSGSTSTSISGLGVASTPGSSTFFSLNFVLPMLPAPEYPYAMPLDGAVGLSWNAVTGAASYNIYWATSPGVMPATGTKINTLDTSYTHNFLSSANTYYYVITAVDAGGVEGLPSTEVSAQPNPGLPI